MVKASQFRVMSALLAVVMVLTTFLAALPTDTAQAAALDWDIPNGHYFTQTNGQPEGTSEAGFSVTDKDGVLFWTEFQKLGGSSRVGYPMSRRFEWDGFTTQVFQKAVFQWRENIQAVYFINVFDQMSLAGKDDWLYSHRSTPAPIDGNVFDADKTWDEIVEGRLALLDDNPGIRSAYNSVPDPITLFGLPTSKVVDNGDHYVMRFQRAVIQQWKEAMPWAEVGEVTIANGGAVSVEAGMFDESITTPMASDSDETGAPSTGGGDKPPTPTPPSSPTPGPVPYTGMAYGMQGHFYYGGRDVALDLVRDAGFGWIKQQVLWEWVEPYQKGQYQWDQVDQIVDGANARGLKVLLSITAAPGWATGNNPRHSPPNNYQDAADFFGALAAHFKGGVHAIEVWNGQNLSAHEWGGYPVNAGDYVRMLKGVYPAIKAADPNIIVISGALTPTGWNDGATAIDDAVFMEMMYQAGLKDYCDAVGAHPGGYNNPPGDYVDLKTVPEDTFKGHPSFYFRRVEMLRDIMVRWGDQDKKMWFTEFGWSTANQAPGYDYGADNSEEEQARYLVDAFAMAKNWGWVGGAILWNLNFANVVPASDEKAPFGILYADLSPRPSYIAVRDMPK